LPGTQGLPGAQGLPDISGIAWHTGIAWCTGIACRLERDATKKNAEGAVDSSIHDTFDALLRAWKAMFTGIVWRLSSGIAWRAGIAWRTGIAWRLRLTALF